MEEFDMQKLNYFITDGTVSNLFTGSKTKDSKKGLVLRYLVKADLQEEKLHAFAWKQDVCYEKAVDKQNLSTAMEEAGLEEIHTWLNEIWETL